MHDGFARSLGTPLTLTWTLDGEHARLRLEGELDVGSTPELEHVVAELVAAGVRDVELDLAGLDFVDSAGLRSILRANADTAQAGGSLVLVHVPSGVQRLLALTGIDGLLVVR